MAAEHRSEGRPEDRSEPHRTDPQRAIPTVLSLTKYIPYPSVTHAGGEYVLAHDRALLRFAQVENLSPDTPINREALTRLVGGPPASLLEAARPRLRGAWLAWFRLESVWAGSSVYWPVRRLFRGDRAPWGRLERATLIEFQWSEMFALAPLVRRRVPGTPLIGIAHDVMTQRWQRMGEQGGSAIRRLLTWIAGARCRRREAATFRALDLLIVFSEKDARLARELAPATRIEVVPPGLGPTDPLPRAPRTEEPMVLFTGAMNRPENQDAVTWFLDEMWPRVLDAVPTARFTVAGANPPAELRAKVERTPRAELTGFVESLEPWYAEASVFVVPLRTGAGVKFKTVDAMLRGVPTVTTSVGAEGIGGAEEDAAGLFAAVTDEAGSFAEAVVGQLRAPDVKLAERTQRWADGVYGVEAFERRIRDLYGEFLTA